MITLKHAEWKRIHKQLTVDWAHKPSVVLLREVMKRELGFTTRAHEVWDPLNGYSSTMYLDFYDEAAEILFRLKYL